MARSLKVDPEYIKKVKLALQPNGYPSQKALGNEVGLAESTVKKFLNGLPVDYLNFVEISRKLGFDDWQDIAYREPETQPDKPENNYPTFSVGLPIAHPRYFFGREKELKRLFNLLKTHPLQNAAIIGKGQTGKTSLLRYLETIATAPSKQLRPCQKSDWLPHPENYCWIFVDFQNPRMASREHLLGYILEGMGLPIANFCNLDNFMEVVSSKLSKPTIILMDEIGVALQRSPELDDTFWEGLRSLATTQTDGKLAFVLATPESPMVLAKRAGRSSPFFNIFGYTATIGRLMEIEARALIASSPIPFPVDDVEWILGKSGRWAILLQILCRECLFSLEEGETGEAWREEGEQQMMPFRHLLDS